MQRVIEWIKTHLTIFICASASVLGIALAVMGILLPGETPERLKADQAMLSNLQSIKPVNQTVIAARAKIKEDRAKQLDDLRKKSAEQREYEVIVKNVFPAHDERQQDAPRLFKSNLRDRREAFLKQLKANDAPSESDIQIMQQTMESEQQKRANQSNLGQIGGSTSGNVVGNPEEEPSFRSTGRSSDRRPAGPMWPGGGGPGYPRSNLTPKEMAEQDPTVRASISRARGIFCYANNPDSFDPRQGIQMVETPTVDEMWYAQVSYWIQADLVAALANMNNAAAKEIKAPERPWVGNLPVKHLSKFVFEGYAPPEGGAAASPGGGPPTAGMIPSVSFTGRGCSDTMDYVYFSMELVLDSSELLKVIDAISKAGLYTLLQMNLKAEPPNPWFAGPASFTSVMDMPGSPAAGGRYIYGSSPAIRVTLRFEACFSRGTPPDQLSKYARLMPESVRQAIKEGRAGIGSSSPSGSPPGVMMPGNPEGGLVSPFGGGHGFGGRGGDK